MKKSELQQLIREEYNMVIQESNSNLSTPLMDIENALVYAERAANGHPRRTQIINVIDKMDELLNMPKKLAEAM